MIKLYSKEKEMNHKIQTNGDITEKSILEEAT